MCDLINLESPNGKSVAGTKLASPLIPAPSTTSSEDKNNLVVSSSASLNFEKRNSLDNNPFDNAHHKTIEYTSKKEDPFEVALEKALMYENCRLKVPTSNARAVEFKDDFTPKKIRYSDILKMNKTLDDSLTDLKLNTICEAKKTHSSKEDSVFEDSHYASSLLASRPESKSDLGVKFPLPNSPMIPRLCVESVSLDSSILNQSAMNDSLTESSGSVDENLLKSVMGSRMKEKIRAATRNPDFLINEEIKRSHKLRRSMSQGDQESPRKFRQHRTRSIVDDLKVGRENDDGSFLFSVPSIFFEDSMNKAFLQSILSGNNASVVSNISNISAISRLTSVSSGFNSSNSSSAFSNRTANCGFIESSDGIVGNSSETNEGKLSAKSRLRSNGSVTPMMKSPIEESGEEKELNDLIFKYSKLRTKSNESTTNEVPPLTRIPSVVSGSGIFADKSICPTTEDKLIDVDVFVPQSKESPESFHGKSGSSTSSDSVFIDSNTIDKSIFSEAKTLARTFEELAAKTGSSSTSSDDLINSRRYPNFDLLPLSDDEVLVDDLIELKKSPGKYDTETAKSREESDKSTSSSDAKSEKSMLKELEKKIIDPDKKITASTLLLDLEKLVKSENNPEATELLKSLEKALGVSCESNADLLAKCLSVRNDLAKSPKKIENSTENENIKNENNEKSREDNTEVETSESLKQLSLSNDNSLENNFNVDKEIKKSDKSLMLVSEKNDESPTDKRQINGKGDSSEKINDDSIEAMKQQNQITDDQKIAVELLVGLGKLLTGENKDPVTSTLLKNLGIALNLASSSNNCDHDVEARSSVRETKRLGGTSVKNRVATPPRKSAPLSAFSRPANRRSLELSTKAKTTGDRVVRRSTSVTRSPTSTTSNISRIPNSPLSADKTKAHLKDGRKRFSSDPSSDIKSVNGRKFTKDITLKPVAISELARQDKPSSTVVGSVKNKLRKKSEPDVGSKKGPMKAILPLGNMQRRGSSLKRETSSNGSVTPPKPGQEAPSAFTVRTSTPFPIVHLSIPKKVSKSKPIASSTPDDVGTKHHRRSASQIPQSPGKNTFSCNISPVTSKMRENNDDNRSQINSSSSKTSKIGTPPMPRPGSQLPRLSPMLGTKSNRGQRRSEPLPSFLLRGHGAPKSPGGRLASDGSTSPLNNSNKLGSQVKPLNLISKLDRRRADKENCA